MFNNKWISRIWEYERGSIEVFLHCVTETLPTILTIFYNIDRRYILLTIPHINQMLNYVII